MKLKEFVKVQYQMAKSIYPRIAVMVSGGIDSGYLLYCLAELEGESIIPMTVPRADNAKVHGQRMIDTVFEKLNLPPKKSILTGEIQNVHHSQQVKNGIVEAFEKDHCDALFLADNITPNNDLSNDEWAPQRIRSTFDTVIQPFFDFTKDFLIKEVHQEGLDFIFKESHSCTEKTEGRCSKCWQCRERIWAFQQANIKDPGQK